MSDQRQIADYYFTVSSTVKAIISKAAFILNPGPKFLLSLYHKTYAQSHKEYTFYLDCGTHYGALFLGISLGITHFIVTTDEPTLTRLQSIEKITVITHSMIVKTP